MHGDTKDEFVASRATLCDYLQSHPNTHAQSHTGHLSTDPMGVEFKALPTEPCVVSLFHVGLTAVVGVVFACACSLLFPWRPRLWRQHTIYKGNEKMDQFKLLMNWNQEELEQWALASRQKEEDNLAMEKYKRADEARVKELNLHIEKLTKKVHTPLPSPESLRQTPCHRSSYHVRHSYHPTAPAITTVTSDHGDGGEFQVRVKDARLRRKDPFSKSPGR